MINGDCTDGKIHECIQYDLIFLIYLICSAQLWQMDRSTGCGEEQFIIIFCFQF